MNGKAIQSSRLDTKITMCNSQKFILIKMITLLHGNPGKNNKDNKLA